MTTIDLKDALALRTLAGSSVMESEPTARTVDGCYIGDLLSWVMGRAQENNIWLTVMGNVNAIAVAKLADLSCIVLCEGSTLDKEAKVQADANGIPVFSTEVPLYETALAVQAFLAQNEA